MRSNSSGKSIHTKVKHKRFDDLGSNLVFIISQPRAGSTLLQRLLAGHPDIFTTGEPWIMLHPLYALKRQGMSTEYQAELARQGLDDFLMHVPEGEELYIQALRKMGSVLYNRITQVSGKSLFLDKTPRYYLIISELYRVFPNARFLFLLRNPIAVLSSVLATWFGNNPEALVKSKNYIDILDGPKYLVRGIQQLKEDAIIIHYEKLVEHPKEVMRHACNRIGIPFLESILDYGRFPAPKGRFGDAIGIHKHVKPVRNYARKWIENLAAPNLVEYSLEYLSRLGPQILSQMGYPYDEIKDKLISLKKPLQAPPAKTANAESGFQELLELEPSNDIARLGIEHVKSHKEESTIYFNQSARSVGNGNTKSRHYVVSAIVSTYNAERFIRECLKDLEEQTISDRLEIIVVNTGSEQNERAIVKEFQEKYSNIRYIETDQRETVYAAWNRGIKVAKGKYITNANTDDRHRKDAFEVMLNILENLPEVALVYADMIITQVENETFENCTPAGHFRWLNWDRQKLLQGFCFMGPQPMWRKSLHEEYGYFDDSFVTSGDYEFWLRTSQTHDFLHIPAVLGLYLKSPNSIEHSNRKRQRLENDKILQTYRTAYQSGQIIRRHEGSYRTSLSCSNTHRTANSLPESKRHGFISYTISVSNHGSNLKRCLNSIKRCSPEKYEIIVVQNGSRNATKWLRQFARQHPNTTIVRPKGALSITKCYNEAMKASSGEYILLLRDDVIIPNGSLSGMLKCINSLPDAGIVGPMTNDADGKQKVASSDDITRETLDEYANCFAEKHRDRRVLTRHVGGFCVLFKRKLIERIGLLDETLESLECATEDFCVRAALEGYNSLIAGDAFVYCEKRTGAKKGRKKLDEKWHGISAQSDLDQKVLMLNAIEKAKKLSDNGYSDKAVDILLKCIGQFSDSEKPYYALAEMLIDAKQFKDALDVLNEMPPEALNVKRKVLIGYCKEGMELYEEAETQADQVLQLHQNDAQALNLKGILAYKKNQSEAAASFFNKAVTSDPGHGEPYSNLGTLKWKEGDKEAALDLYERGFILSPAVTDIATLYHSAITQMKRFERGQNPFIDAVQLYPENKRLKYLLIDILIQQSKQEVAMKYIEEAMIGYGMDDGILSAALNIRKALGPLQISKSIQGNPSVSLCMIVKNEEKHLAKCLRSAKPVVDEMIVVDTGSNDRTKDIATAFGAKVYDFEWTGDFSEARNLSLTKASGDWILVLDADEVISRFDYKSLIRTLRKKTHSQAYSMTTRNYVNNASLTGWTPNDGVYESEEAGTGWFPSSKVRLFRNQNGIKFENPVHELVEPSADRLGITIGKCNVPIHHYGKLVEDRVISKGEEYYELGKLKLTEKKDDLQALTELAIQAGELKKYEDAVTLWKELITRNPDSPKAFHNMGYAYIELGNYKEALIASKKAIKLDADIKGAHLNYSICQLCVGDVEKAISSLENLLRNTPDYPPAMGELAIAYCIEDNHDKAIDYISKLKEMRFNCIDFLNKRAKRFISVDRHDYALKLLSFAVESNNADRDTVLLLSKCLKNRETASAFREAQSRTLHAYDGNAFSN